MYRSKKKNVYYDQLREWRSTSAMLVYGVAKMIQNLVSSTFGIFHNNICFFSFKIKFKFVPSFVTPLFKEVENWKSFLLDLFSFLILLNAFITALKPYVAPMTNELLFGMFHILKLSEKRFADDDLCIVYIVQYCKNCLKEPNDTIKIFLLLATELLHFTDFI